MTSLLAPFSGFIPTAEFAPRIVGPPTSMLTNDQKNASRDDELSFRHVVGRGAGAHYETAMSWLDRCLELGALLPVESSVIVHATTQAGITALGLIADVSLTAYDTGLVKRHETTIAKTERKMLEYMQSTRLFGNPVALAHRDDDAVASLLHKHSQGKPDVTFESIDGSQHSLWIVGAEDALDLCARFNDALYVTDGHHRLAGASSLAAVEGRSDPHIPAGLFAENQLNVWAFARVVSDDVIIGADIIDALGASFELKEVEALVPRPAAPRQMGVRIDERSFVLTVPDSLVPDDAYDRLDVNLLQSLVLEPLFDVTNPRTDERLSFVADTGDHAHQPDDYDAWFLPYPTSVDDVMSVADTGRAMPPKSTYFLPKLPSGLVIRPVGNP